MSRGGGKTIPALIQVVPPGTGGVLDYLMCVKSEWAAHGVSSDVIELSKALAGQRSLAERVLDCLNASGSGPTLPRCSVVLHFSGYGYGHRGVCFWLLDQVRALRAQYRHRLRLVVVCHELFASGQPPWRSAFWLSHLQWRVVARLARMADALWTNTEQHARSLRRMVGPATPIQVRPVFSNVGEPEIIPASSEREPRAIVFGSPSTRQRAFDGLQGKDLALQRLGVVALIEVGNGGPSKGTPAHMACRHLGRLEQAELSRLLRESRYALLDYPPQYLGKSGVFAAYAAHGCVALNVSRPGPDTDGLAEGSDYLCLRAMTDPALPAMATASPQAMAANATRWYGAHRLDRQAAELLELAIR
ncbi:MAG TPA: glycosyltransferase [Rhizobacter sp.]|nr:glycosyltransferase [Rhizobacter sp.]